MTSIERFLDAYASAYETFDPAIVAEFFHCPCIFFLHDDCVLLDTDTKIIKFLQAGLETYRANNCKTFSAKLLQHRKFGPRFGLIDVEWEMQNGDGETTMNFTTTYNVVLEKGSWKVCMITRHDQ